MSFLIPAHQAAEPGAVRRARKARLAAEAAAEAVQKAGESKPDPTESPYLDPGKNPMIKLGD